jgi:hypothetical protein
VVLVVVWDVAVGKGITAIMYSTDAYAIFTLDRVMADNKGSALILLLRSENKPLCRH